MAASIKIYFQTRYCTYFQINHACRVKTVSRVVSGMTLCARIPTQTRHGPSEIRVGTDLLGVGKSGLGSDFFRMPRGTHWTQPIWPTILAMAMVPWARAAELQ